MGRNALTKVGGILVGLWLLGELTKGGGHAKTYRCWRCNGMITPNQNICPWCRAKQNWRGIK